MSQMGHEDAFPRPRLSARCRFSQVTYAAMRGSGITPNEQAACPRAFAAGSIAATRISVIQVTAAVARPSPEMSNSGAREIAVSASLNEHRRKRS
jgi:hypothetical protein